MWRFRICGRASAPLFVAALTAGLILAACGAEDGGPGGGDAADSGTGDATGGGDAANGDAANGDATPSDVADSSTEDSGTDSAADSGTDSTADSGNDSGTDTDDGGGEPVIALTWETFGADGPMPCGEGDVVVAYFERTDQPDEHVQRFPCSDGAGTLAGLSLGIWTVHLGVETRIGGLRGQTERVVTELGSESTVVSFAIRIDYGRFALAWTLVDGEGTTRRCESPMGDEYLQVLVQSDSAEEVAGEEIFNCDPQSGLTRLYPVGSYTLTMTLMRSIGDFVVGHADDVTVTLESPGDVADLSDITISYDPS